MRPQLVLLLLGICLCLFASALGGLLLHRANLRARAHAARVTAAIGAYRRSPAEARRTVLALGRTVAGGSTLLTRRVLKLIRYDPQRAEDYPGHLRLILAIALLLATVLGRGLVAAIGTIGWFGVPVLWLLACRAFYGWRNERVARMLYQQFPDALAMIVRAVRVGLPVLEAVRVVAREASQPTARQFAILVDQVTVGVPLDDAVRSMAERNVLPEYRFFSTALSLQSQTGGGLSETLEGLADTIRKRVAARMKANAMAAEARMSAYILGALPIVTGVLLSLVNPGYMSVLFTDHSGRLLLLSGFVLLGLGAASMRMLIRKSLA